MVVVNQNVHRGYLGGEMEAKVCRFVVSLVDFRPLAS